MPNSEPTLNGHLIGNGFDSAVCTGRSAEVDGPCPKYTSGISDRCSACGCPMVTMSLLQAPPSDDDCPRVAAHRRAAEEDT